MSSRYWGFPERRRVELPARFGDSCLCDLHCECGQPLHEVEGGPDPLHAAWAIQHRAKHLAHFPECSEATRQALDEMVEAAMAREGEF